MNSCFSNTLSTLDSDKVSLYLWTQIRACLIIASQKLHESSVSRYRSLCSNCNVVIIVKFVLVKLVSLISKTAWQKPSAKSRRNVSLPVIMWRGTNRILLAYKGGGVIVCNWEGCQEGARNPLLKSIRAWKLTHLHTTLLNHYKTLSGGRPALHRG